MLSESFDLFDLSEPSESSEPSELSELQHCVAVRLSSHSRRLEGA